MTAHKRARLRAPLAHLSALLALTAPAMADSTYPGWRGQYGTGYTAYRAGAYEPDRRPLDGSYRNAGPLPSPGTWTGLYLGAHLGAGVGSIETSNLATADLDLSTFLGGLQAGYNMQFGQYVAGLEIDTTWTSSDGDDARSGSTSISGNADWLSSARLRLGYTTGDLMVYATGGVALGGIDLSVSKGASSAGLSDTMVGYAVGGGLEYKLTDSWIARVEAIHYGFGEEKLDSSFGNLDADTDITTIRAGLSLRLN